jgi:phosphotransferase system HPr-like phosphotransfer protein
MSEASIDEVLSEEDFQPLAKERGERFGRLAHTLLARAPGGWTRRHFYQLIVEADAFEAFLDDHGAAYNRTYRLFRELVASVRGLARAGYAVRHLESRFDSYGTRLSAIPIEEERFCEAVEEARRFLEESLRGLLAESMEEAARRGVDLSSASFSEDEYITDRSRRRLPRNLDGEIQEDEEHYIASVASRYLDVCDLFDELGLGEISSAAERERYLSEICTEERARVYEASVHNLQSAYDTYIGDTALEESDDRLPRMRGHISVAFHLLEAVTDLVHFVERHEGARSNEASAKIAAIVDRDRVVQIAYDNLLAWAVRMIHLGREYAEALVPTYTNQRDLTVEVPDELTLHARPVSLIVKIVDHHGTPVSCEVDGSECNAGSILEMMITVGSNSEARRYIFTGDERPLADIQRLFEAGLGEGGLENLPKELEYLRR